MLEVLIPNGFADTSKILVGHLNEMGVDAIGRYTFKEYNPPREITARVCWGIPNNREPRVPTLNAKAGTFSKLNELEHFKAAEVPCPTFWRRPPALVSAYPILGRQSSHACGEGIAVCNTPQEAEAAGSSFFTKLIPSSDEYRVWVYKDRSLGCYLRERNWTVRREGFGRNWWNGWGFTRLDETEGSTIPARVVQIAKQAIAAVGYDFGAVDILKGEDRTYYALEVNSAPGAEYYCKRALWLLAENVKRWYEGL